ncbi:MAG: lipid II:glycine glycyltransferase FemX [Dissulfurispiraceae bacterium]
MFTIINPVGYPKWDVLLVANPEHSFFHSSCWAKVLSESYGYTPCYFTTMNDNRLAALIAVMEIRSIIRGKRGVSLPFTDYCEPIFSEGHYFQEMMSELIKHGKQSGWKSIEIRSGKEVSRVTPPSSFYYGHVLKLLKGQDALFSNLRDSTKRNIRKAEKEGVSVRLHSSPESVSEFYRLNCLTRKMHGLPPQPSSFFRRIYEYIILKGHGFVALALHEGKTVAGAVYFNFGNKALFKYGASDKRYQHIRANNLIMWEAIKWYSQKGYTTLCFGRTEPENKGLRQFKAGWGAEEHIVNYYKYDLIKESYIKDLPQIRGFHNKVFTTMPMPLLRITGSLLYKHMG